MKFRSFTLTAAAFGVLAFTGALAQEAPALKNASPEEKARVEKLIEGAKQEGSVSYWDTVIQPTTNDNLVKAFKAGDSLAVPGAPTTSAGCARTS